MTSTKTWWSSIADTPTPAPIPDVINSTDHSIWRIDSKGNIFREKRYNWMHESHEEAFRAMIQMAHRKMNENQQLFDNLCMLYRKQYMLDDVDFEEDS